MLQKLKIRYSKGESNKVIILKKIWVLIFKHPSNLLY